MPAVTDVERVNSHYGGVVTDRVELSESTFVIRRGKRGTSGLWVVILAVLLGIAIGAIFVAISQPTHDGQGGAGHVVIPALLIAFSLLGLGVALGQWWDDETHFSVSNDRLLVRHGTRRLRGRSARFVVSEPVAFVGEGSRDSYRVFVEQDGARVNLGNAAEILPLQYVRWEQWMRAMGVAVVRRMEGVSG